jgi:UDP-3-O-[3-hydroxymyristoyl] glucosamine N-acyltransferase
VGDLVKVGAQSGIAQEVPDGAVVSGTPAVPHGEWLRASVLFKQLPELVREVRTLKKKLAALEAQEG